MRKTGLVVIAFDLRDFHRRGSRWSQTRYCCTMELFEQVIACGVKFVV